MKHYKNISIIILLNCLIVGNMTRAQNFYTCIPEESWIFDALQKAETIKVKRIDELFNLAQKNQNDNNHWDLVFNNKDFGKLQIGVYKVIVAGGKGNSGNGCSRYGYCPGGSGGNGHVETKLIKLYDKSNFKAVIGHYSRFNLDDVEIGAAGGGRGGDCICPIGRPGYNNYTGSSSGNGKNSGSGYVHIYKYK